MTLPISVLISIYKNDNPDFLNAALQSIINQTAKPSEIILVKDGPIANQLEEVLTTYINSDINIKVISLNINQGLGKALNQGLLQCSNEIVARMDSDDICKENRFEEQYNFLVNNPDIDICGSWVDEFTDIPNNIVSVKKVPENHTEIKKYARFRNPMNHPTVMFRKKSVIEAGNYLDCYLYEDYYLWVRMLLAGKKFYNIPKSLLFFRGGPEMLKRRSGFTYAKSEFKLFKLFKDLGFLNNSTFITLMCFRLPCRLIPPKFLNLVYKLLRKHTN